MMKRIIINADDFGLSKSINKGIIRAYREGVLTSASLMVNMPGFEDAVSLIEANPGLGIGLHINFFRGKPLLSIDKVRSLVDKDGFFIQNVFEIIKRIYQRRIELSELRLECEAQIKKALASNINITHIDSEKHLHLIGYIYEIVVKSARKYGINKIRNINGYSYIKKFMPNRKYIFSSSFYKTIILQFFSMRRKKINSIYSMKTADYSFGLADSGAMTSDRYEELFNYSDEGTTEVFCHPGYIDGEWQIPPLNRERYYINSQREDELKVLLSPCLKEIVSKLNIRLISYKEL